MGARQYEISKIENPRKRRKSLRKEEKLDSSVVAMFVPRLRDATLQAVVEQQEAGAPVLARNTMAGKHGITGRALLIRCEEDLVVSPTESAWGGRLVGTQGLARGKYWSEGLKNLTQTDLWKKDSAGWRTLSQESRLFGYTCPTHPHDRLTEAEVWYVIGTFLDENYEGTTEGDDSKILEENGLSISSDPENWGGMRIFVRSKIPLQDWDGETKFARKVGTYDWWGNYKQECGDEFTAPLPPSENIQPSA